MDGGWFNNYVTPKLPFLTRLPPTITLCCVFSREPSSVTSRSAQAPPLFSIKNDFFSYKHWLALGEAVIFSCQHHLKTPFFKSMYWKHIPSTFEYKFKHLNIIGTFKYSSKFKYKHSNLRLKHYLHYKVRWKRTNKSYKTCYFGLRIPHTQSFL